MDEIMGDTRKIDSSKEFVTREELNKEFDSFTTSLQETFQEFSDALQLNIMKTTAISKYLNQQDPKALQAIKDEIDVILKEYNAEMKRLEQVAQDKLKGIEQAEVVPMGTTNDIGPTPLEVA